MEQSLSDAIATEQFIVEADRQLAKEATTDLRSKFEMYAQQDETHLENMRKVLQDYGGKELGPSEFTTRVIDACRSMLNSNESFLKKLGAYGMLKRSVAMSFWATAYICQHLGDRNCEQLMFSNLGEVSTQGMLMAGESIGMIDSAVQRISGQQAA